eukprot:766969-Hanusia_phi.AAC.2
MQGGDVECMTSSYVGRHCKRSEARTSFILRDSRFTVDSKRSDCMNESGSLHNLMESAGLPSVLILRAQDGIH